MNGYGEYHWTDGRKYSGYYKDDKKEGFGIYAWNEDRAYFGFWKDGKQHGVGRYDNKGERKFAIWEEGRRMKYFESKDEALSQLNSEESKFIPKFELLASDIIKLTNTFLKEIM